VTRVGEASSTKRLFVALELPAERRAELAALSADLGGKPEPAEQIHLTLRFIGDAGPERQAALDASFAAIAAPAFSLVLTGGGTFPERGRPRVVWAGLEPYEPLLELARRVELACRASGLTEDRYAFSPHVTLARLRPDRGPPGPGFAAAMERVRAYAAEPFLVRAFTLFSSVMSPRGSTYSVERQYALGAPLE
jgi:2'-5' RNA ligase